MRLIDADALLLEIAELKKSPWYNDNYWGYSIRKEAVEIIEDLCIKTAPTVEKPDWHYDEKDCTWCPYKHDDEPQTESVIPHRNYKYLSDYWCKCGWHLGKMGDVNYCPNCGKRVQWERK